MKPTQRRLFGPMTWCTLALLFIALIGLLGQRCYPLLRTGLRHFELSHLIAALGDDQQSTRELAFHRIVGEFRSEADAQVRECLRMGNDHARPMACALVVHTYRRPDEGLRALMEALRDPLPEVRRVAAREICDAIVRFAELDVLDWDALAIRLAAVLDDPHPPVRELASRAFYMLGDPARRVMPDFDTRFVASDYGIRWEVAKALMVVKDDRHEWAESTLIALVGDRSAPAFYRGSAAGTLLTAGHASERRLVDHFARALFSFNRARRRDAVEFVDGLTATRLSLRTPLDSFRPMIPGLFLQAVFATGEIRERAGLAASYIDPDSMRAAAPLLCWTLVTSSVGSAEHTWAMMLLDRAGLGRVRTRLETWQSRVGNLMSGH